jgi:cell division protein FtsX
MEGLIYGLAGAIIAAILLLAVFLPITHTNTPLLQVLIPPDAGTILRSGLGWIILDGICFGFFGSWLSLARSIGKAVQA